MEFVCHYSALGIDANSSSKEIASAYAASLARLRKSLANGKPVPVERLDAMRNAYRILSNEASRRSYDAERRKALAGAATGERQLAPVAAQPAADAKAQEVPVEFRGSGGEYFRIWLVNMALTLLTLGFYSAWAKVRREKYFHRNMVVDGSAFDYHGRPRAILLGRLVLVLFFALAAIAEKIGKTPNLIVWAIGAIAFPWLLLQSMRFRARNTSYRGLRFEFGGTYPGVLFLFLVHGMLTLVTLGFYFPAFLRKQKAFVARHLRYGNTPLAFSAGAGAFYRGLAFPLILWCLVLGGAVILGFTTLRGASYTRGLLLMLMYGLPVLAGLLVLMQLIMIPYARVVGSNLLWNHLSVGGTRFRSTQKVRSFLWIVVSNWALTLLTLGFFWPLGQIRLARFRARNLFVINPAQLAAATAASRRDALAVGSETMAALDLDIAI